MSKLNGIKNIIFDLGGVILDIDFTVTQREFAKLGLKNIESTFGQYHQIGFFDQFDRGEIDEEEFLGNAKELFPDAVTTQQIKDAWNAMLFDLPPHRFELLKELGKKYRLFLMSNTNIIHYKEYQDIIRKTYGISGLDELFEKAYYSFLVGMRKPEDRFFNLILNENGLAANETLFIDDTSTNTDAAEKLGVKGLWLQPGNDIIKLCEN
ncbi:D-ribitol-5-phosphate phosphatase [bioreactor metagenome]|uniref:D-ribitol-5-phosphate phosphatase n=1 Tax=bioreactor metagenome TaxID=1076179 RepID=A0A644XCA3_9ZZZZ